ncbi:glycosyltransferase [Lactococcus lactis]|uniref:glycosyltransferase n=1 Tax=Lactococcus lactis TaxID=1358 RepID=UPI00111105E7|nr:glycosyltransferase [Lactococcus lactis]
MARILLAPNPTGTGHNMRMLSIAKRLIEKTPNIEVIVLLGSRQDVFTNLFENEGIKVIDLSPTGIIDYSKDSHLEKSMNWNTMISKYFVPTFFNGDKILKYLELIKDLSPDLLISDYNINASLAGIISGTHSVFVTERHNFTLVDVELDDLILGGFQVDKEEIGKAQQDLNSLFNWIISRTDLIITDKPLQEEFKSDIELMSNKKTHFVGSMYSDMKKEVELNFEKLLIDPTRPYIIGTMSSTTMLKENLQKNIDFYKEAFLELKPLFPELQLVIIGSSDIPRKENDIVEVPYIPNWRALLEHSKLLISHSGWITVTEVAYLDVPALFYLSSFMEYHELEAFKRLNLIGVPVFSGYNVKEFCRKVSDLLKQKREKFTEGYRILNPTQHGIDLASDMIEEEIKKVVEEKERK